ncbi:Hypothetical predicted protein [Paramuricea clavata]|uniref:Uncharacterized protein n=1 Tax=Paramuricea clavata TaxID=317549 RepID=A0A6S7GW45_PARCT|nr:Hypothetical predicted protein [Paramuricea clavata]
MLGRSKPTADEERCLLAEATPKNTAYNTKLALKQNCERYTRRKFVLVGMWNKSPFTGVEEHNGVSILAKGDRRFTLFPKTLDAEMKNATNKKWYRAVRSMQERGSQGSHSRRGEFTLGERTIRSHNS